MMALATDSSWQKTLCCPRLGSNGPPSKVWMERLIFAVDETTELGNYRRKMLMFDVHVSTCSPFFVSTKVTVGTRR